MNRTQIDSLQKLCALLAALVLRRPELVVLAAPFALAAAGVLVVLALVSRHAHWELLGHRLWWMWLLVAAPYVCLFAMLLVGLAPGLQGANRTGRPFTGDYAGILLYKTLHEFGFSNQATSSHVGDGLVLRGCRITNAARCVPPENKPEPAEIPNCRPFLSAEIAAMPNLTVALSRRGVTPRVLEKILGGNVLRVLDAVPAWGTLAA